MPQESPRRLPRGPQEGSRRASGEPREASRTAPGGPRERPNRRHKIEGLYSQTHPVGSGRAGPGRAGPGSEFSADTTTEPRRGNNSNRPLYVSWFPKKILAW